MNKTGNNYSGCNNKKVFNLRAEKLIREASDNFIYFKDYDLALKQIDIVLKIDNQHVKALMLRGDILLCIDKEMEALKSYEEAIDSNPNCAQAYGSKASVLDMMGRQKEALEYCKKAFNCIIPKDKHLLVSLYDQKLSILHSLNRLEEAKKVLKTAFENLIREDAQYLASCYQGVIQSKVEKQEITEKMSLQLVY